MADEETYVDYDDDVEAQEEVPKPTKAGKK